jgi:hypothetical protein
MIYLLSRRLWSPWTRAFVTLRGLIITGLKLHSVTIGGLVCLLSSLMIHPFLVIEIST